MLEYQPNRTFWEGWLEDLDRTEAKLPLPDFQSGGGRDFPDFLTPCIPSIFKLTGRFFTIIKQVSDTYNNSLKCLK